MYLIQWRSQDLEVRWAQGVFGTEVSQRSPGAEAKYAYRICSGQTHFRDVFIEDIRCTFRLMQTLLPLHPFSCKKTQNLCKSHDPPRPRWGGHVGYATDLISGIKWEKVQVSK